MSGNILEAIRQARDGLSRAEQRVADFVLQDPHRLLDLPVASAAELAGVSQPTVIRFAAAIGCGGYRDFKIRLSAALALGQSATHSVLEASDGPEEIVAKIFDYTLTSLDWARGHLDRSAIAAAIDLLVAAERIHFFGFGASGIVARDAQQKFPLFGVPCLFEADAHQQFIAASMAGPGDVGVLISNTGSTSAILDSADRLSQSGARTIALTGAASALAGRVDVPIVIESLDNTDIYTPTISRIAALVVVDILATGVALRRPPAIQKRMAQMKDGLSRWRASTLQG